jgi:hypothetical protein
LGVLAPIEASWRKDARAIGRPTAPMDRLVRLMIVKARCGCGYETLQVIGDATRPTASKRRFVVRAAGIDSTVVETDAQVGMWRAGDALVHGRMSREARTSSRCGRGTRTCIHEGGISRTTGVAKLWIWEVLMAGSLRRWIRCRQDMVGGHRRPWAVHTNCVTRAVAR